MLSLVQGAFILKITVLAGTAQYEQRCLKSLQHLKLAIFFNYLTYRPGNIKK